MGGGSQASPPPPQPLPPPAKQVEKSAENAAEAERLRRLMALGRSSTSYAGTTQMGSSSTMG